MPQLRLIGCVYGCILGGILGCIAWFTPVFAAAFAATSACGIQVKGPVKARVLACEELYPFAYFGLARHVPLWLESLPKRDVARGMASHRGQTVKLRILRSKVQHPLLNTSHLWEGETLDVFVQSKRISCEDMPQESVVGGFLKQACCYGALDVPCLAQTSLLLQAVEPHFDQKEALLNGIDPVFHQTLQDARLGFTHQLYTKAASLFEKAATQEHVRLGAEDRYQWAYSLYAQEPNQCHRALPLLQQNDRYFILIADEMPPLYIRHGKLLMARCFGIALQAAQAVRVLDSLLVQGRIFREEIKASLTHPDFGWITHTEVYRDYASRAEAWLRNYPTKKAAPTRVLPDSHKTPLHPPDSLP